MDDFTIDKLLHTYLEMEDEEDEIEDDEEERALAALAIYGGAEQSGRSHAAVRQPSRLYLCQAQLLPNPRINTPWQRLRASRSDRAYITTMGYDVATFDDIIASGFGQQWYDMPLPRADTNPRGKSRPGARSLDAEGALGLVLHYLNSTMREISLQEIFALVPTTVSRYITFALDLLLDTFRKMEDASVRWPKQVAEFEENSAIICLRHPLLTGAFASIDGLNLPVQTSEDEDIENATYNGWKSDHFVSSVLVFSPQGKHLLRVRIPYLCAQPSTRSHHSSSHKCTW
jgi:hypothetical protein